MASDETALKVLPYSLHLLSLSRTLISPKDFLAKLREFIPDFDPLVTGKPRSWIVPPTGKIAPQLLGTQWDIMLLLPHNDAPFPPPELKSAVTADYAIQISLPESTVSSFPSVNHALLHPSAASIPPIHPEWSNGSVPGSHVAPARAEEPSAIGQILLTTELAAKLQDYGSLSPNGAVTMLNLIDYMPNGGRERFSGYVQNFGPTFKERIGTVNKLAAVDEGDSIYEDGAVREVKSERGAGPGEACWDLMALVHYPSIWHFGSLLTEPAYLELEEKYKMGSLRDTAILAVDELAYD